MSIARYYINNQKWIAAINRLKTIVDKYDETVFIEEALFRLVRVLQEIGITISDEEDLGDVEENEDQ